MLVVGLLIRRGSGSDEMKSAEEETSASLVSVVNDWCSGDGNGNQSRLQQKVMNVCNAVFRFSRPAGVALPFRSHRFGRKL